MESQARPKALNLRGVVLSFFSRWFPGKTRSPKGMPTQKKETPHMVCFLFFPPAESFGVSAQWSGVVRGGEVRFHEGSARVPPVFHEGSTRFCEGASTKKSTACCELIILLLC